MNCLDFKDRLDEYLEGALGHEAHDAAAAHLRDCRHCQRYVAHLQSLRAALRNLPVPEARPDFYAQAFDRAERAHVPARAARRWPTFAGLALAASLALWLGFGWLPNALREPGYEPAEVQIVLHEPRTVQLAFHSERALAQATLRIRLPEGVELQGFPGQREIEWRTDLASGVNVLPLPLLAVSPGRGEMLAELQHGERRRELIVPLRVSPAASSDVRRETCVPAGCRMSNMEGTHAHA